MPKRKPDDVSDLAPWVEWERIAERVRSAKSSEQAIDLMKRHFRMALDLQNSRIVQDLKSEKAVNQAMKEHHERVRAMAKAIAGPSERDEWGKYYPLASQIDAALQARKKYEI